MSRNILAFALVISFAVGPANGQDAKKPLKAVPDRVVEKAKGPGQPTVTLPRASAAKPKLRPSAPHEQRLMRKGYVPELSPSQRRHNSVPIYAPTAGPPKAKAIERKREVIRLSNSPAMDVANTINQLLMGERSAGTIPVGDVVIVPDAVKNCLMVSAAPQAIAEIVELVEELDAPPAMVTVRVLMAEIVSEGKSADDVILDDLSAFVEKRPDVGKKDSKPILLGSHEAALAMVKELAGQKSVEILARSQITALDNQSAYIQVGGRVPRATATRGDKPVGIEYENVGLILGVTPRINPDGTVTMDIDFEKSELEDADDGALSPSIDTIRVQTTVSVADGRTLVLGGIVAESGNEKRELLMVVTPHVIASE